MWKVLAIIFASILISVFAEDVNDKLKRCCASYEKVYTNKTAVDECLHKYCNFDSIGQTNVLVFLKHCDSLVVGNMFSCASSNADHTECCKAKGVSGKCLEYCSAHDGAPTNYIDYVTCLDNFNDIRQCFMDYLETHEPIRQ